MTKIWLNGEIINERDARIDPHDRGLLLADGFFETMLFKHGKIFHLMEHFKRFSRTAEFLKIPLSLSYDAFRNAIMAVIKENNLSQKTAVIRFTVTRGAIPARGLLPARGFAPTILIHASEYQEQDVLPLRLSVSRFPKNEFSPLTQIKSLQYLDGILSRMEAEEKGFDDALMLNTNRRVAETTIANIFIIKKQRISTPRIEDGILPGITREIVKRIIVEMELELHEEPLSLTALKYAEEIFTTNSVMGIRPVGVIDNHIIGNGKAGMFTQEIMEQYKIMRDA
ncbi:MAG: aminotransferase class IV [Alphaproteobacteria bacterium]